MIFSRVNTNFTIKCYKQLNLDRFNHTKLVYINISHIIFIFNINIKIK